MGQSLGRGVGSWSEGASDSEYTSQKMVDNKRLGEREQNPILNNHSQHWPYSWTNIKVKVRINSGLQLKKKDGRYLKKPKRKGDGNCAVLREKKVPPFTLL